jgi:hypothetical protein
MSSSPNSIIGRWNLVLQLPTEPVPAWLEVHKSGHSTLVGRFVSAHGSARPVSLVTVQGDDFSFAIPPQWERGEQDLAVEGWCKGDGLAGNIRFPDGTSCNWTGVRAPSLRHAAPAAWGEPITLFNGVNLDGWEVIQGESKWVVEDGILRNLERGGNLRTNQTFGDFKLHLEFRYAPQGNSGVYLRGRYEVQVLEQGAEEPDSHLQGGVYGFLAPSELVNLGAGEWQSYDITLIGRYVTIVLNGKTVITNQAIPGITGGALDSDEGAPGPLMLQGDHTACDYRNIVITPAV